MNQSWISEYKKLTPDGKDWVKLYPKKVNEMNVMKLNTSNDSNANLIDTLHDINSKPIVAMKLSNEEAGNEIYFRALLDPGSFSNSTQEKKIVSYSYHILLVVSH